MGPGRFLFLRWEEKKADTVQAAVGNPSIPPRSIFGWDPNLFGWSAGNSITSTFLFFSVLFPSNHHIPRNPKVESTLWLFNLIICVKCDYKKETARCTRVRLRVVSSVCEPRILLGEVPDTVLTKVMASNVVCVYETAQQWACKRKPLYNKTMYDYSSLVYKAAHGLYHLVLSSHVYWTQAPRWTPVQWIHSRNNDRLQPSFSA